MWAGAMCWKFYLLNGGNKYYLNPLWPLGPRSSVHPWWMSENQWFMGPRI